MDISPPLAPTFSVLRMQKHVPRSAPKHFVCHIRLFRVTRNNLFVKLLHNIPIKAELN